MTGLPVAGCRDCVSRHWLGWYLVVAVAVAGAGIWLEYSGFDVLIASRFHDAAIGAWPHRHGTLFEGVLYRGERMLAITLYAAVLCALAVSLVDRSWAPWRRALLFVAVAGATGPIIVSVLKSTVHVYVPWRLAMFGGDLPYVRLFDPAPPGLPPGNAFPGGHSSGAFGWTCVYFLLLVGNDPRRRIVLGAVIAAGLLFAATQSVRGAHFPSHDLFTLAICWLAGGAWARVFFPAAFGRVF